MCVRVRVRSCLQGDDDVLYDLYRRQCDERLGLELVLTCAMTEKRIVGDGRRLVYDLLYT